MTIITISRGTFSGGKLVAEKLAERLGYPCLSREMITKEAAEVFDIEESQLNDAMSDAPTFFSSNSPVSAGNINFVRSVLLKRLRTLELVYHGYAGDLLLRGVKKMLRVRIIAGHDYRIEAAMKRHSIAHEDAIKMIQDLDQKRDKWAQIVLGVEWSDPSLYDVAFNLDFVSVDSVVDILELLTKLKEFTVDESTSSSVEDLILSSKVWAALFQHKQSWALQVHVMVQDGQVTIYGDVVSNKLSVAICSIAGSVDGVETVINKINVGSKWLW